MASHGNSNIADEVAKTFAEYVVSYRSDLHQRPSLLFRIHSYRLRVQANAKSLRERLLSGPMVDVYVGGAKRHWSLHRNLLAYHSEYLEAELQQSPEPFPLKNGSGASNGLRLDLPEDEPAGFELLVKWLYQGRLDDVSSIDDDQEKYEYAVACQKLHILCDRFELPKLKNIAMDQYRKGLSQAGLVPDAEELSAIYKQSSETSPFRKLMVKIAARQIMDPDTEKDAESYRKCFDDSPDFAIDLVNAIKAGCGGGMLFDDPTESADCEFHDHDNGPNCHIKGKGRKKLGIRPISNKSSPPTTPTPRSRRPSPPKSPKVNGLAETNHANVPNADGIDAVEGAEKRRRTPSPPKHTDTQTPGRKPPPKLRQRHILEQRAPDTV
ncbi:hypothetical protein FKW77_008809 [Venturia effusa]|uniref:BTB domain-containing protein n=1 Tax=Venturia effusa TaxID=50376 RepID=A0A517L608_9PEZI|nr:hypothetical protein FKW77_008809 [Venturia effusa]